MENQVNENVVVKTKGRMGKANIWATVVMIVLGILAVVTILMAIIPKSYAIELPKENPNFINIYQTSTTPKATLFNDEDKELYDELWDAFNSSFKQSSLSALFQKELGNTVDYNYVGSNTKSLSSLTSDNNFVLGFVYADVQTLYKDGDPYVCEELKTNSNYTDGVVTFKKIWVTVNDVEGVNEVKFYVQKMVSAGSSESTYAVLEISTKGLQSELVDVINKVITEKA